MNKKDGNDKKQQTTAKPNNDLANTSLIPSENKQIKSYSGENKRQNTNNNSWPNIVQAVFTGLIFIATCAYVFVSIFQWNEMQRANTSTEKTVCLAERNIKTTQEQFRQDQRAWVGVSFDPPKESIPDDIDYTPVGTENHVHIPVVNRRILVKEGKTSRFEIWITNTGKTPAKNHYGYYTFG